MNQPMVGSLSTKHMLEVAGTSYHWVMVDRETKNKIEGFGSLKQAKRAANNMRK